MSESSLPPLDELLDRLPPDHDSAMDAAIWAWADQQHLPHTEEIRNRVACTLFATLATFLEEEAPDKMGWCGLRNREFAKALKRAMKPADPDDPNSVGSMGVLELAVAAKDGMVALRYAPDLVVALPVDTARTLANGLFGVAEEIDGLKVMPFVLGVPPHNHPEKERTRR